MIARRSPENDSPITWVGRVPVYATTVIVAVYVAGMVAVALMLASGARAQVERLSFDTNAVLRDLELWRCATYAFVNPPDPWFIVSLVMFYIFGRDVEIFLGRAGFVRLYAGLLLLGPSLLLAAALATGQDFVLGQSWANFAVFLSFAALYPNAQLFLQITARLFAWVFLAIFVLQLLAARQWAEMIVLLSTASMAWYAVRHGSLPRFDFLSRLRPVSHRMQRPHLRIVKPGEDDCTADPHRVIDPLLDKISREGIASLSRRERDQLERARVALMRKENPAQTP